MTKGRTVGKRLVMGRRHEPMPAARNWPPAGPVRGL